MCFCSAVQVLRALGFKEMEPLLSPGLRDQIKPELVWQIQQGMELKEEEVGAGGGGGLIVERRGVKGGESCWYVIGRSVKTPLLGKCRNSNICFSKFLEVVSILSN